MQSLQRSIGHVSFFFLNQSGINNVPRVFLEKKKEKDSEENK